MTELAARGVDENEETVERMMKRLLPMTTEQVKKDHETHANTLPPELLIAKASSLIWDSLLAHVVCNSVIKHHARNLQVQAHKVRAENKGQHTQIIFVARMTDYRSPVCVGMIDAQNGIDTYQEVKQAMRTTTDVQATILVVAECAYDRGTKIMQVIKQIPSGPMANHEDVNNMKRDTVKGARGNIPTGFYFKASD